jgi:hypothetical protein
MKLDIVNNEDGPLARSTFNTTTTNHHNRNDFKKKSLAELPKGVEERLQNIEEHLKVETGKVLCGYYHFSFDLKFIQKYRVTI